ncbi:LssY C-terminal domain-containing protein [bacterium]|nr:LssY C-terminal domain-containing protein [bacterium]
MPDLFNTLLPSIEHYQSWGYWIAFFAALLETTIGVGLFLPGSTVILLLGAFSAHGYFDLSGLLWSAVAGAVLGDNVNYFLGRRYGSYWLKRKLWFINKGHVEKAKRFMDTHGAKSIFLGRFIPSVKEIAPFIAGSIKMNRRAFLFWNTLGAVGWGLEWVLAGYLFAQSLNVAEVWLSRAGLFLGALLLIGILFYLVKWLVITRGKQFWRAAASLWRAFMETVAANRVFLTWVQKHPKITAFSKKRVDTTTFSGLPLTLLSIALIYLVILFAGLVEDLITSEPVVAADIRVASLMSIFRTERLTDIFIWITLLGKSQVILAFITTAALLLFIWRKYNYILPLFIAVIGSGVFAFLGKMAIHRPRPEMAVYAEEYFSFPSAHATIALSFYGFLAYLVLRRLSSWKSKVNMFFISALFIMAIGLSRIYLGVHYISDIWSGYLIGAMWLLIAVSMSELAQQKHPGKKERKPVRAAKPLSAALLFASAAFYVSFAMNYHYTPLEAVAHKKSIVARPESLFSSDSMRYSESLIGKKEEPINFIFLAEDDRSLLTAFQASGWLISDQATLPSLLRLLKSSMMQTPYLSAPVSPSFWNAKMQNWTFTSPAVRNKLAAQHIKIWKTDYLLDNGRRVYIGMAYATEYGMGVIAKLLPDIDAVRERLFRDLNATGTVSLAQKLPLVRAQTGKNFTGQPFYTDGKAYLLSIRTMR